MIKHIIKIYHHFMDDSLYRNSIYLMASTLVMAAFGFGFWMINARLFSAHDVGLGSTLISIINLISGFSILGLNIALVRFLPNAKNRNELINSVFSVTALSTIVVATIFLLGINMYSPQLGFLKYNIFLALFFIGAMVIMVLFTIIESVFIAYRAAKFVLIKNTIFSTSKLVFPFLFISLGSIGIFGSWIVSALIGCIFAIVILILHFGFRFKLVVHENIVRKLLPFSFGNYIAGFLIGLPLVVLPIMTTNLIGPEITAYFYISMMIANILFLSSTGICQSLLAEGSKQEKVYKKDIVKTIRLLFAVLLPSIIIVIFFGHHLLLFFGNEYSTHGISFLRIITVSAIFIAVNRVSETLLRVKHKIMELIIINILGAFIIIGGSYLLIDYGLSGIGYAWFIGQLFLSGVYSLYIFYIFIHK